MNGSTHQFHVLFHKRKLVSGDAHTAGVGCHWGTSPFLQHLGRGGGGEFYLLLHRNCHQNYYCITTVHTTQHLSSVTAQIPLEESGITAS